MPKSLRDSSMPSRFGRVVCALVDAMAQQNPTRHPTPDQVRATTEFLVNTHRQMPDYLRLGLGCLTFVFDAWSYPFSGRPFHRLPLEGRRRQITAWEHSRFGPRNQLMLFYRSLVTFSLYSDRREPGA